METTNTNNNGYGTDYSNPTYSNSTTSDSAYSDTSASSSDSSTSNSSTLNSSTSDTTASTEQTTSLPKTMEEALDERVARNVEAHETLKNYVLVSMAVGLVPVPLIDIAALIGIQLKLVHSIAQQYNVPFSSALANSLIASLLGGVVTTTTAMPLASMVKLIPFVGSVSGFLSVAILGGATTYAVGKVFIQHFESGGTFLDFEPEKVKEHFKSLFEEGQKFAAAQANNQS